MGAFATDAAGVNSDKAPFFVGKFKKGESVAVGAQGNLFSFAIDGGSVGGEFPLTFIAGLLLVEADLIHNKDFGNKLAAVFSLLTNAFRIPSSLSPCSSSGFHAQMLLRSSTSVAS